MENKAVALLYGNLSDKIKKEISAEAFSLLQYEQIVELVRKFDYNNTAMSKAIFNKIHDFENTLIDNGYGFTQVFRPMTKDGVMEHITIYNWFIFIGTKATGGTDQLTYKDSVLEAMHHYMELNAYERA